MKKRFLVGYDYGTGSLLGVVQARSKEEILAKYPKLIILDKRPNYLSEEVCERAVRTNVIDVDDEPHGWWLQATKQ